MTGRVKLEHLKKNGGATVGCKLFLTKPLGVGILTTAQKKEKLLIEHSTIARDSMVQLNKIGEVFGKLPYVKAMTDVTGFGLLGHLSEMCEASNLSARLDFNKVPTIDKNILDYYLAAQCIPGGTHRNWESYEHKIASLTDEQKFILADPQTSGGLLVAVEPDYVTDFQQIATKEGFELEAFGEVVEKGQYLIGVK